MDCHGILAAKWQIIPDLRINLSRRKYLSRLFKKEMGITLTAYIADLRTKKAAELLKTSMLSVAEIAMYVGYPDSNYFVKVFKKRYGMTPSAYRSY